ncbi:MAG: OB-fold nucleic acid binding domain-containing protein, partial [Xanthobacteraceae bacterium]
KSAAAMQKQLEAATRQRDAALSEAAALKRRTEQLEAQPRPAPAPPTPLPAAGGKVYTQRSVAELRELYAGGEAAPGTPPVADETGKWIETTSMRVVGIAGGGVLMLKKDNSNVQCAFAEVAKAKLATLRVGDAVRVSGKINSDQNGQLVNLEECELRE